MDLAAQAHLVEALLKPHAGDPFERDHRDDAQWKKNPWERKGAEVPIYVGWWTLMGSLRKDKRAALGNWGDSRPFKGDHCWHL